MNIKIRVIPTAARTGLAASALVLGAGLALAPAASAATGPVASPFTPEENNPTAWCSDGYKVTPGGETFTFTLDEPADILVLKAATTNYVWTDVEAGTYTVPGKNAISHVIVCPADEPTQPADEPTQPVDEPTEPADEPTEPVVETTPAEEPTEPVEETTPVQETEPAEVTEVSGSSSAVVEPLLAETGGEGSGATTALTAAGLALLGAGAVAMRLGRRGSHS